MNAYNNDNRIKKGGFEATMEEKKNEKENVIIIIHTQFHRLASLACESSFGHSYQ